MEVLQSKMRVQVSCQIQGASDWFIIIFNDFQWWYTILFIAHSGLQTRFRRSLRISSRLYYWSSWPYCFLWAGLVVSVVDAQPGDTIIDCCAAPGGKALNIASRLNGQGMKSQITNALRISKFYNHWKNREGDSPCNHIARRTFDGFVRVVQARL